VRNGVTIAHGSVITDAAGDGAVNGGGTAADCWTDVTPDILPGDEIHVIGSTFDDSMIVQGTSADMPVQVAPGTVVVHGTASDPQGNQLPASGLEARVTSKTLFSDGKRVLRAGTGQPFALSYDASTGPAWTATFSDLSAADVALALNPLESRGVFTNAAANESTISQNPAAPGPGAPCSAPLLRDAATSSTPASVNIAHTGEDLVVSGVAQDASAVSVTLGDGATTLTESGTLTGAGSAQTWSATFPGGDVGGLRQGTLTATPSFTTAGGTIGGAPLHILKDLQAPGAPVGSPSPAAGPFDAPQSVSLSVADTTAQIHWTNDGTTPDASSPVLAHGAQIAVTASQTIRAIAIDPAGNAGAVSTLAYTIVPRGGAGGTTTTGTTTIIQQVPFVVPLIAPNGAVAGNRVASPARPAVRGLSVAVLRGHALRVTMRVGSGARVVRLRVLRASGGPALVTVVRSAAGGRFTATLSSRALRALRRGSYVLEARAGASRAVLGAATRTAFRLR
jgi:Chitobiase/beta-hexosaminidase C-terminal domain